MLNYSFKKNQKWEGNLMCESKFYFYLMQSPWLPATSENQRNAKETFI